MCWSIPGKVVEINGKKGIIQIEDIKKEVFFDLLPDAVIGDYVLVHAGYAIQKIHPENAEFTIKFFKGELIT